MIDRKLFIYIVEVYNTREICYHHHPSKKECQMKHKSEGTKESKDRDDGKEKKQRQMGFFDQDHNQMVVCVDTLNEEGLTVDAAKKAIKTVMEGPAKTRFVEPIASRVNQSTRNALNVKFIDIQQLPAWFSNATDYNNDFEDGQGLYTWRRQVQLNYFDKGQPPDEFRLRDRPPGYPVTPPTRNTDDPVYMGKIDLWILPSSTTWHGYAHQQKRPDVLIWDVGVRREGSTSGTLQPGEAKQGYPDHLLLPGNDNDFVYKFYDRYTKVELDEPVPYKQSSFWSNEPQNAMSDDEIEHLKKLLHVQGIDFWKPKRPIKRKDQSEDDFKYYNLRGYESDLQPFIWAEQSKLDLKVDTKNHRFYYEEGKPHYEKALFDARLTFRMPQAYIDDALYRVGVRIYRCHPIVKRWVALDALDDAMGPGNKNTKEAMLSFMTGRVRGGIPLRKI
jgi:hypothetical protein